MSEGRLPANRCLERAAAMYRAALPATGGGTLEDRRDGYERLLAELVIPDDVVVAADTYAGVDGYWVEAAAGRANRLGVMLHGGGYIIGSASGYRAFAAYVSMATRARIFVPEYRLAPEHPFPAAMEDAQRVIAAAVREVGPDACFAIGDSAGGGLMLSALIATNDQGSDLPACIVLVSPLIDLTVTNGSYDDCALVDPIVSRTGIERASEFYLAGRGVEEAPEAFPMVADLSWLPPCLVMAGTAEVLLDDARNLAAKLQTEKVDLAYHEYEGMIHNWPLFSSFLPEGRDALELIGAFVDGRLSGERGHPGAGELERWLASTASQ